MHIFCTVVNITTILIINLIALLNTCYEFQLLDFHSVPINN